MPTRAPSGLGRVCRAARCSPGSGLRGLVPSSGFAGPRAPRAHPLTFQPARDHVSAYRYVRASMPIDDDDQEDLDEEEFDLSTAERV